MSDRALIAFETSDGKFDLHHSHNGAGEIGQLLRMLEEYHKRNDSKRPGSELSFTGLDGVTGEQAMQRRAQTMAAEAAGYDAKNFAADEEAIRPDPEYIEVEKSALGDHFHFVNYEAFLTVEKEHGVTLYAPIWLEPAPMTFLRQHVVAEVYEAESPSIPPQRVFQSDPEYRLVGSDYVDLLEEEDERFEQLRLMQRGMIQMALTARSQALSSGQDPSDVTAMVSYGATMVKMDLHHAAEILTPNPQGFGVFVEVPRLTIDDLSPTERKTFDTYFNDPQGPPSPSSDDDVPEVVERMTKHFREIDRIKQDADRKRLCINRDEIGDVRPTDDEWDAAHQSGLVEFLKYVLDEHSEHLVTWTPGKFAPALERLADSPSSE